MAQLVDEKDTDIVAEVLNASLRTTPFELYISDNKPYEITLERYKNRIKQFSETGAIVLQANSFNSAAVWFPPGYIPPSSSLKASARFQEFKTKLNDLNKKHGLDKTPHWELMFIGKDPKDNKGSVKPLIEPYLQRAKDDALPAVLYAITEHAKSVYLHLGFEEIDHITIGEGKTNNEGGDDENGEGLKVWLMVYNLGK